MCYIKKWLQKVLLLLILVCAGMVYVQAQFKIEFDKTGDTSACLGFDKAGDFTIMVSETEAGSFVLDGTAYIEITAPPGFNFEDNGDDRAASATAFSVDIDDVGFLYMTDNVLTIRIPILALNEDTHTITGIDTIIISGLELRKTENTTEGTVAGTGEVVDGEWVPAVYFDIIDPLLDEYYVNVEVDGDGDGTIDVTTSDIHDAVESLLIDYPPELTLISSGVANSVSCGNSVNLTLSVSGGCADFENSNVSFELYLEALTTTNDILFEKLENTDLELEKIDSTYNLSLDIDPDIITKIRARLTSKRVYSNSTPDRIISLLSDTLTVGKFVDGGTNDADIVVYKLAAPKFKASDGQVAITSGATPLLNYIVDSTAGAVPAAYTTELLLQESPQTYLYLNGGSIAYRIEDVNNNALVTTLNDYWSLYDDAPEEGGGGSSYDEQAYAQDLSTFYSEIIGYYFVEYLYMLDIDAAEYYSNYLMDEELWDFGEMDFYYISLTGGGYNWYESIKREATFYQERFFIEEGINIGYIYNDYVSYGQYERDSINLVNIRGLFSEEIVITEDDKVDVAQAANAAVRNFDPTYPWVNNAGENTFYYKEGQSFTIGEEEQYCWTVDTFVITVNPENVNVPSVLCANDYTVHEGRIRTSLGDDAHLYPTSTTFERAEIKFGDSGWVGLNGTNSSGDGDFTFNYIPNVWFDLITGGNTEASVGIATIRSIGTYPVSSSVTEEIKLDEKSVRVVRPSSEVELLGFEDELCYNSDSLQIFCNFDLDTAQGYGIYWWTNQITTEFYYNPARAYDSVEYYMTEWDSLTMDPADYDSLLLLREVLADSALSLYDTSFSYIYIDDNGCVDTVLYPVILHSGPIADYTVSHICLDDTLVGFSSSYKTEPAVKVVEGVWNFGDGITHTSDFSLGLIPESIGKGLTTGTNRSPNHKYSSSGAYITKLELKSDRGCIGYHYDTIDLPDRPIPDFTFEHVGLQQDSVLFSNYTDTSHSNIINYVFDWDFGEGTTLFDTLYTDTIVLHNLDPGIYDVNLFVQANEECFSDTTIKVPIFPYVKVEDTDFSTYPVTPDDGWLSSAEFLRGENSHWRMINLPAEFTDSTHHTNQYMWITGESMDSKHESSWIESPCFDISEVSFPMISLDIYQGVDEKRDGAVLQYTLDDGHNWINVNTYNWAANTENISGQNWFNHDNIIGNPGEQEGAYKFGWTQNNMVWKEARFPLDTIRKAAGDKCVRFRVAYGSDGNHPGDEELMGFAFNNFLIGKRKRTVLLEHCVNSQMDIGGPSEEEVDDFLAVHDQGEVIDIRYHMLNFHVLDSLYNVNPEDISARCSEYGALYGSQRAVIDGSSRVLKKDSLSIAWAQRCLIDPHYAILNPNVENKDGRLIVTADIKKLSLHEDGHRRLIRVAIVQRKREAYNQKFKNVLLDLLPDGMGNVAAFIPGEDSIGSITSLNIDWFPDSDIKNQSDPTNDSIRVVIYVQAQWGTDEVHTVWSGDYDYNMIPDFTEISDINHDSQDLWVYPNPANDRIFMNTGTPFSCKLNYTIYLASGKVVLNGSIFPGDETNPIDISELNDGVYIVELSSEDGKINQVEKFTKLGK